MRLDKVQAYEDMLADPLDAEILGFLGYPRLDLDDYKNLVVTSKTFLSAYSEDDT